MTRPNAERAYAVLDHIKANPELWRQEIYIAEVDYGRVACFAGWTALLFGEGGPEWWHITSNEYHSYMHRWVLPNGVQINIDDYADQLLGDAKTWGIGPGDDNLFATDNTMDDLERMVAEIFGPRPSSADFHDDICTGPGVPNGFTCSHPSHEAEHGNPQPVTS